MLTTPSPLMSCASRTNFLPLARGPWCRRTPGFWSRRGSAGSRATGVAVRGVRRRDQLLEAVVREVQREELGEVAPLGVVTRQQDYLVAEHVGVVLEVGVHLALDVRPLRVELVVLGRLRRDQVGVLNPRPCGLRDWVVLQGLRHYASLAALQRRRRKESAQLTLDRRCLASRIPACRTVVTLRAGEDREPRCRRSHVIGHLPSVSEPGPPHSRKPNKAPNTPVARAALRYARPAR